MHIQLNEKRLIPLQNNACCGKSRLHTLFFMKSHTMIKLVRRCSNRFHVLLPNELVQKNSAVSTNDSCQQHVICSQVIQSVFLNGYMTVRCPLGHTIVARRDKSGLLQSAGSLKTCHRTERVKDSRASLKSVTGQPGITLHHTIKIKIQLTRQSASLTS